MFKVFLSSLVCGLLSWATYAAPATLETLRSFGDFPLADLNRLLNGEVFSERGSLMDLPGGIFAQSCFAVPIPAGEAARRLQTWDPSAHESSSKVLEFHTVHEPCYLVDFQDLSLKIGQSAQRWLLEKSLATTPEKSELNLTHAEARELAEYAKENPNPEATVACWVKLLQERATAFQQQGFDGVLPYESAGGEPVSPTAQIRAMLGEKTVVVREFAPLLRQCGLLGGKRNPAFAPFLYWGLCDANRHATLNLGAVYLLQLGDRFQLLDVEYYVSGTYHVFATLYEVWPIQIGDRSGTLIWRGDFFASPALAFTKGTERLAYGMIMAQELRKAIHCFQNDANISSKEWMMARATTSTSGKPRPNPQELNTLLKDPIIAVHTR